MATRARSYGSICPEYGVAGQPPDRPSPGYVGYGDGGKQPHREGAAQAVAAVLFDEIEKAHEDVGHLLQIMDDGQPRPDSARAAHDFSNTVIVNALEHRREGDNRNRPQLGFTCGAEPDGETTRAASAESCARPSDRSFSTVWTRHNLSAVSARRDMLEITQTLLTGSPSASMHFGLER